MVNSHQEQIMLNCFLKDGLNCVEFLLYSGKFFIKKWVAHDVELAAIIHYSIVCLRHSPTDLHH